MKKAFILASAFVALTQSAEIAKKVSHKHHHHQDKNYSTSESANAIQSATSEVDGQ